jgi:peroxiredoxin Q/BCP
LVHPVGAANQKIIMNQLTTLIKALASVRANLSPDCKTATRLNSASLDRVLPWRQRFGLRLHVLLCKWCRRYTQQVAFVHHTAHTHAERAAESVPHNFSSAAKNRIKLFIAAASLSAQIASAAPSDFTLHSATDTNTFKFSAAKGKFVALHFLLKTECPYCLKYTRTYSEKALTDARVIHVFIKPDSEAAIKQWTADLGGEASKLTIYRDPDAKLADEFAIPNGYHFHGQVVHYPALILLDGSGQEVFRYVGKSNADRCSYEHFATKLDELTAKK